MFFNVIQYSQFFSSFISIKTLVVANYIKFQTLIIQFQFKLNRGFTGKTAFYSSSSQKIKSRVIKGYHKLLGFINVKIEQR